MKLLFVTTEDWFFASHFLGFARAAQEAGFEVSVACNSGERAGVIEAAGIRVIPVASRRKSASPLALLAEIGAHHAIFRREKPDIVHLVALKPMVIGGIAARLAGVERRVMALTGTGYLGVAPGIGATLARLALKRLLRLAIGGRGAQYLFENRSDPSFMGLDASDSSHVTIVGGAGVELSPGAIPPLPHEGTLKVAVVARMLWQKGIDTAVEATRLARQDGVGVELSLFGEPDAANPRALSAAQLRQWSSIPGVTWHGATRDVPAVWASHHAACLPSRGGEGLPRTLLEAAAAGRALLTTQVPGCQDLVHDRVEGRLFAPGDALALAAIFRSLADHPHEIARMGANARLRIEEGFTTAQVTAAVMALYRRMMASTAFPP